MPTGPEEKTPFWLLQVLGWSAYGLATFFLLLPEKRVGAFAFLVIKLWRAALGFAASLLLLLVLRQCHPRSNPLLRRLAIAVVASACLGFAWFCTFRFSMNPVIHLPWFSTSFVKHSRDSLENVTVLLAWSGIYLALEYW
jgi:hypothetical protein